MIGLKFGFGSTICELVNKVTDQYGVNSSIFNAQYVEEGKCRVGWTAASQLLAKGNQRPLSCDKDMFQSNKQT